MFECAFPVFLNRLGQFLTVFVHHKADHPHYDEIKDDRQIAQDSEIGGEDIDQKRDIQGINTAAEQKRYQHNSREGSAIIEVYGNVYFIVLCL